MIKFENEYSIYYNYYTLKPLEKFDIKLCYKDF